VGNFLSSREPVNFSRRTLLHAVSAKLHVYLHNLYLYPNLHVSLQRLYQTMHILTHSTSVNPHPVSTASHTEDYSCYSPQTCATVYLRQSLFCVVGSVGWLATDVSAQRTCLFVMDPVWCPDILATRQLKLCNKIFRHSSERD